MLNNNKITLQKKHDKVLQYTQYMHMQDSLILLKNELKDVYGYSTYFKNIIIGDNFGEFVFIGKNSSIQNQTINYSIIDDFIQKLKRKKSKQENILIQ